MTVITDISVPADQFALGELFEAYPRVEIELVRVIPLREGVIPLLWVKYADPEAVEETLGGDPLTESVRLLTEADGRHLFEIRWSSEIDSLVTPLIESGAEVLRADGTAEAWEFRLQFSSRALLGQFRDACRNNDVHFHLDALYNPVLPAEDLEEGALTSEQFDILATAHEHGYWQVPRDVELREVADLIGISSNAASQRMRRGLDTLVGRLVADKDG